MALFDLNGTTWAPSRLPTYPTYKLSWEEPVIESADGEVFAAAPYLQQLSMQLSWSSISKAERDALVTFFLYTAKGPSLPFLYNNAATSAVLGAGLPVRFGSDTLPELAEIAYDRYQLSGLTLLVDTNYPQIDPGANPPGSSGSRFVIGGIVFPFATPLRPAGVTASVPATMERNTSGDAVVYRKSNLTFRAHSVTLLMNTDEFAAFREFFFSYVHGRRNKFTWVDHTGTSRTVRLADPSITVVQSGRNRFIGQFDLLYLV